MDNLRNDELSEPSHPQKRHARTPKHRKRADDSHPHQPGTIHFLDFSPEIRRKILSPLLPNKCVVQIDQRLHLGAKAWMGTDEKTTVTGAVLRLSKSITAECLDMLYGNNLFEIWLHENGEEVLLTQFSEANRRRIRHLVLVARSRGASTFSIEPRLSLWSSLLPRLSVLQISIDSFIYDPTVNGYRPQTGVAIWTCWIEFYLAVLSEYLVPGTEVYVQGMREKEVNELFQKYIPPVMRIRSDFSPLRGTWWAKSSQS